MQHLTEKQRAWLLRVDYICEAHDIGVPPGGFNEEDAYDFAELEHDVGDR